MANTVVYDKWIFEVHAPIATDRAPVLGWADAIVDRAAAAAEAAFKAELEGTGLQLRVFPA